MYTPEQWVPKPKKIEVFAISIENLEDIKFLLGATSARVAYNRNRTILIEWTMMHRETFSGLVGQYILRDDRGRFQVLDAEELRRDFQPYVDEIAMPELSFNHDELGRLVAVHNQDGVIDEVIFELPDGTPATFVSKEVRKDEEIIEEELVDEKEERRVPTPGPPKHNKEKN